MRRRVPVVGLILVLILFSAGVPGLAAPLMQARSVITSPASGQTVSGIVEVTGIATHPNLNFYQLRYAAGPEPQGDSQWVDFAIVQATPVENGVLASWDTTGVPDGEYTMALAVWGQNDSSSPYVFFVTRLRVNNAQPVPSPTPEATEMPTAEPMPTMAIGATPSPVTIEQPATPTPRPTATVAGAPSEEDVPAPPADEGGLGLPQMALDTGQLGTAFCTGGLFAILLLLIWGAYLLLKAGVRWFLRQRGEPPIT
jgi:hypothetical protein